MSSLVYRGARRMERQVGAIPVVVPETAWLEESTTPKGDCSCQCFRHAVADFTQHSSLHGLRYVADQSISKAER